MLLLLRGDPAKPFHADALAQSALWVRWLRPPVEAALRQLAETRVP